MSCLLDSTVDRHPVAVSSPGGGVARQYVVQCHSSAEIEWRRYASFRDRQRAKECADRLQRGGLQVRLVAYGICPSA